MKDILAKLAAPATEGGNLSIGRVMLLACFILAMVKWVKGIEIPDSQITILMTLIGYVLGTKVITGAKEIFASIKDTKNTIKSK
jgi:hypothetical protein